MSIVVSVVEDDLIIVKTKDRLDRTYFNDDICMPDHTGAMLIFSIYVLLHAMKATQSL